MSLMSQLTLSHRRDTQTHKNVDTSAHIRISAAVFILNLESMPYTGWTMNISETGHFAACIILSDCQPGWSPFFTLSSFFHCFKKKKKNLPFLIIHCFSSVISPLPSFCMEPQTGRKEVSYVLTRQNCVLLFFLLFSLSASYGINRLCYS